MNKESGSKQWRARKRLETRWCLSPLKNRLLCSVLSVKLHFCHTPYLFQETEVELCTLWLSENGVIVNLLWILNRQLTKAKRETEGRATDRQNQGLIFIDLSQVSNIWKIPKPLFTFVYYHVVKYWTVCVLLRPNPTGLLRLDWWVFELLAILDCGIFYCSSNTDWSVIITEANVSVNHAKK